MMHSKKEEIRRKLEISRMHLTECRELIKHVFEAESAEMLNDKLYRALFQIGQVKELVKD